MLLLIVVLPGPDVEEVAGLCSAALVRVRVRARRRDAGCRRDVPPRPTRISGSHVRDEHRSERVHVGEEPVGCDGAETAGKLPYRPVPRRILLGTHDSPIEAAIASATDLDD